MELRNPIIKSDQQNVLLQMIVSEDLYESGWIFNIFAGLVYDKFKKQITFSNYEWLWKYGIFIKKYVEYPFGEDIDGIKSYLEKCIRKNYIIGYIQSVDEYGLSNENIILYYDFDCTKDEFLFYVVRKDGIHFKEKKGFYEIYNLYYKSESNTAYKFDVLRPIQGQDKGFSIADLIKDVEEKRLNKRKLLFLSQNQIKKSIAVFEDWYSFFNIRLKLFLENDCLNYELHDIGVVLKSKKANRIKLFILVSKYNKICDMIRSYK